MKIPAVAFAAAFDGGIVLGLQPQIASHVTSAQFVIPATLGIAAVVCLGLALTLRDRLLAAGILSLVSWVALGVVAACAAQRPPAADHVLRRIAAGTVELKTPLRWHRRPRSEPARLPWGSGIDVDLSGVDEEGGIHSRERRAEAGIYAEGRGCEFAGGSRWG
jgi:hypothetical protein